MDKWGRIKIGDIATSVSDTYRGNDKEVILVNTSDVLDGTVLNHQKVINGNLRGQFKKTFQKDDILYSEIRPANKRFAYIDFEDTSCYIASTKLMVIRPNTEMVLPRYLYAILTSNEIINELQHLAETRSGTFPQITFSGELAPIEIMLPDLDIQQRIVDVLSAIEGKRVINQAINQNLEQQLDALYKSWFVDLLPFDGMVPSSWKYGKLKDVLKQKRDSVKPGLYTNLPYLPIDSIPMNSLALNEVRPNEEALSSLVKFAKNDILIGAMRVYFHRVVLAPFDGITRTTCFTLKPYNLNYLSFALLVCNQDASIEYAQKTSKGSTMPYAIWDGGLGDMELLIPSEDDATRFNELALPLLSKIQSSYFENTRLQNLRDILLPKLMSGELDVSELHI